MGGDGKLPNLTMGQGCQNPIPLAIEAGDAEHGILGGLILNIIEKGKLILEVEAYFKDFLEILIPNFNILVEGGCYYLFVVVYYVGLEYCDLLGVSLFGYLFYSA